MGELIYLNSLDSPDFDAPTCPSCGTVVADPGELCAGCSASPSGDQAEQVP
jgi:hypothetical protein